MSPTADAPGPVAHVSHRPEQTLLYQLVKRHYPVFARLMAEQGSPLPGYVAREFEDYLKCGRLEHGFLRARCESCHHEKLVAFSCKRRGFCPSCGARHMVDSAALLVDEVLPKVPLRQEPAPRAKRVLWAWVLSVPFQLRFLFASYPPPTPCFWIQKQGTHGTIPHNHRVSHKLYAAGVVLTILLVIGGFVVNKAWGLMIRQLSFPSAVSPAYTQPSTPAPPSAQPGP